MKRYYQSPGNKWQGSKKKKVGNYQDNSTMFNGENVPNLNSKIKERKGCFERRKMSQVLNDFGIPGRNVGERSRWNI